MWRTFTTSKRWVTHIFVAGAEAVVISFPEALESKLTAVSSYACHVAHVMRRREKTASFATRAVGYSSAQYVLG